MSGTLILILQAAIGGQCVVDICLTTTQFSALMAVLTGLEKQFMNETVRRASNNNNNTNIIDGHSSSVNNMGYDQANVDSSGYMTSEIIDRGEPCLVSPYDPSNPTRGGG